MKNKNYRQSALLSFIILFLGYLLIRYALLGLHKMKEWPTVLFGCCFLVIVACYLKKKTITPLITSLSYSIGFVLGYIFQTNGVDHGEGTINNLWLIWTITILIFVFISIVIELFLLRKSNRWITIYLVVLETTLEVIKIKSPLLRTFVVNGADEGNRTLVSTLDKITPFQGV